ncbi:unnamed protein product [Adineta ricciae]|uniref:Uncharacterized protein n=1 Tax=Adineta ricciae TaxID=249248 RepID=A0A816F099_ADIRI|nr:unnamed protein product [Adineta ricciae]
MNRTNSCSRRYRYVSPMQRLLERTERWKPKKAKQERQLQELCRQGKLKPFEQPKDYRCYFIHEQTSMFTMDQLIDEAKQTIHYTLDTEGDPIKHLPGTIQIEFVRPDAPTTVIVIEVNYLPPITSLLFTKIKQLCSIILSSNNTIFSWGDIDDELKSFMNLDLFTGGFKVDAVDVQKKYDPYDKCGLQSVIESTYRQYLDKTATLAEWSCGIDFCLGTYRPRHVHGEEYRQREQDEKDYRRMLQQYAINDVFAVTKIARDMKLIKWLTTPPTTAREEEPADVRHVYDEPIQEQPIELEPPEDEPRVHDIDESYGYDDELIIDIDLPPIDNERSIFDYEDATPAEDNNNDSSLQASAEQEPFEPSLQCDPTLSNYNETSHYDELEPISDDELPEYMKLHLPPPSEKRTLDEPRVHEQDEPKKVRRSYYLGPHLNLGENATKNQESSLRRRSNRYRSEVIRPIYEAFNYDHIKEIFSAINIKVLNVNVRNGQLYIGVKSPEAADELEQILHRRMFTEEHYHHYMNTKMKMIKKKRTKRRY